MKSSDAVTIAGTRRTTTDGFLVVDARFARSGLQLYSARDVGMPDIGRQIRIWRPPEEVFDTAALASAAHRPVTLGHPPRMIDATNWRRHAVGQTGDTVTRDGNHVRIHFALMDETAIAAVEAGTRELSAGYEHDLEIVSGQTPEGEAYDAIQRNIRIDHIAIVPRGRAGPTCCIGDAWTQEPEGTESMTKRTVTVDGVAIEADATSADAIVKLQAQLANAQSKGATTQALDALVEERETLVGIAANVLGRSFEAKGKPNAEIRRRIAEKKIGRDAVADRSDEWIASFVESIVLLDENARRLGQRNPLADHLSTAYDAHSVNAAMAERDDYLSNAWKDEQRQ